MSVGWLPVSNQPTKSRETPLQTPNHGKIGTSGRIMESGATLTPRGNMVALPDSSDNDTGAIMAKPQHKVKKANHGKRPANAKARKAKKKKIKTP